MQSAHTELERASKFLIDNYHHGSDELTHLLELYWSGKHHLIRDHYTSGPGRREAGTPSEFFAARTTLQTITEVRDRVLHYFKNAMALTLLLLLVAIGTIPFVPLISQSLLAAVPITGLVLYGVWTCLTRYVRLVKAILP